MALYPEVRRKAQEEIERVLGSNCLPTMLNRSRLPYINAVVTEALCWHPVAPIAIPHMSDEDDTYGKYFIPKRSVIPPDIW